MSAEQELLNIVDSMKEMPGRFVTSSALGRYLQAEDRAEFKRLAVEAKAILDSELGHANDFSMNLIPTINPISRGSSPGPSVASVMLATSLIQGGINQIRRVRVTPKKAFAPQRPHYVALSRIEELRAIKRGPWDVTRLIRLCEELNVAHQHDCHMTTAMGVRAILDHVPPIFRVGSFSEVANNYGGGQSFKASMKQLDTSLRQIADSHLHVQIRKSEVLPSGSQVDFHQPLDVLLGEVVRLLRTNVP